jgi:hypothetical protein
MSDNSMKVLVVEPLKRPYVQEIDGSLASMQKLVGGTIQAVYPFADPVALICNDEGKLMNLPCNRFLYDEHRNPYDVICGTFFVVGVGDENFKSLTDRQIRKYHEMYSREVILLAPGKERKKHNDKER